MLKHIYWPIIDCSGLYDTGITRIQSVVLGWIGGRGHFRSRDKDGGHTIRSAMAENPLLYANFTTLLFIEPELLPIKVLHYGNRKFLVFFAKNTQHWCRRCWNTFSGPLSTVLACMIPELHAFKVLFTLNQWAWSFPITWQRWRSHHSIRNCRKPPAIRKLHHSIFHRTGVIADWSFTLREKGISRFFRDW